MILCSNCLRAILNHGNLVVLGDRQNGIQVRGLAKQVHWNNRFHFLATTKRLLQTLGTNVVRGWINVNHDRPRAQARHASRGGEECVGRHDHLVAGANAHRLQRQHNGVGTVGATNRVLARAIRRDFFFQLVNLWSANEILAFNHLMHHGLNFITNRGVLRL